MEREEILDRLVRLHDERVAEEQGGKVRWVRPEYQIPRFGQEIEGEEISFGLEEEEKPEETGPLPWPAGTVDQIAALKAAVFERPGTPEEIAERFEDAPKRLVERHLETLEIVGELRQDDMTRYQAPLSGGEAV